MVLAKFRQKYPQGSLVGELIEIDRGTYIVGVSVIVDNIVLAKSLAGADTVEAAEDLARKRAIALLMLDSQTAGENSDRKSSLSDRTQKLTVATSNSASPPSASQEQIDTTNHVARDADSNIVDFAEHSAEKTDVADLVESRTDSEPEVKAEKERSLLEEEPPVRESGNLFAGTSTPDLAVPQDFSADSQNTDPEVPTVNSEPSEFDNIEEVNFNEIKHQTDLEIKRLGWSKNDGREFLKSRYGKRSRLQLTDNQLLEFLQYLASQPSPS